ncbi:MAG: dihydropteroate synthase, partial [Ignavibacteriales bacterium]|nr:dihydropteroate synthase [Ignavibacteriales bacterium]
MADNSFTFALGHATYDFASRTHVMGILNATPDSFSDGGRFDTPAAGIEAGLRMIDDGADILDIGGESTRPGAEAVTVDEELRRVLPVIEGLANRSSVPISVDTYKSEVADRALNAGACIVNDISG